MRERILQISKELGLTHVGSCLGMAQVLEEIYQIKNPEDIVVLDAGHSGLALYVLLEYNNKQNALELYHKHGVHPNRDKRAGIEVSSGSLGLAASVSLGIALANRNKNVYVATSDGAFQEGIWAECLRFARKYNITSWKPYINCNGYGAYHEIFYEDIKREFDIFP